MLTVRQTMRVIVEDVLRKHGVLTTDEIYRGVWAKHAQLGLLLPPRWQEEVRQVLEAHCISLRGNSWFLEKLEPLEERPDGEQIKNDSTKGQNRTDWASIESYRYLDRPLEFRTLNSTEISRSAVDRLPRRAPQSANARSCDGGAREELAPRMSRLR